MVTDLSPLNGMRLETLNLSGTKVADLSVLRGLPLLSLRLRAAKFWEEYDARQQ